MNDVEYSFNELSSEVSYWLMPRLQTVFSAEEKKELGLAANNVRAEIEKMLEEKFAQVKEAARAAQCEEFILKLPKGFDNPVGDAGKRLSGGE